MIYSFYFTTQRTKLSYKTLYHHTVSIKFSHNMVNIERTNIFLDEFKNSIAAYFYLLSEK